MLSYFNSDLKVDKQYNYADSGHLIFLYYIWDNTIVQEAPCKPLDLLEKWELYL